MNRFAIHGVHLEFNSRMTEAMKVAGDAREAKGKLSGIAEQKASDATDAKAVLEDRR